MAMDGVLGALAAAQALTKEEGAAAKTALEIYQKGTEALVVAAEEENQKLSSLLQASLMREGTVAFVHSQTVQALETRVATTEQILEETRAQMRRDAESAKAKMKELIDSHKQAMETALAAERAKAAAEQATALTRCRTEAAADKEKAIAEMKKKMEKPLEMIDMYARMIDGNCDGWILCDKGELAKYPHSAERGIGRAQRVKQNVAVIESYRRELKSI